MNSGIRDAHNLAWKLAAVIQRRLGTRLLDTYEQERRGHTWEMIQLALRMGKVMMPRSAWNAFALQAAFRLLSVVPPARNYFAEMKYKPKPRFNEGFLARAGKGRASPLVGRLFPQPKVRSADRECLLDEFLGNGFALLSLPQTPPDVFDRLPVGLWPPLSPQRVAIRASVDSSPAPSGVINVIDIEGAFSRSVKTVPPGLLLISPGSLRSGAFLPAVNPEAGIREVNELIARTRASWLQCLRNACRSPELRSP